MRTPFALFFLFALLCNQLSAEWKIPVIQDTNGNPVVYGQRYVILPALKDLGGAVTIGPGIGKIFCSGVVQDRSQLSTGTPVVFFPRNRTEANDIVDESSELYIKFTRGTAKCSSSYWAVDWTDTAKRRFLVTAKRFGYFRIGKNVSDYYIIDCLIHPAGFPAYCGNIGIQVDRGVRRLTLNYQTFRVKFKKV